MAAANGRQWKVLVGGERTAGRFAVVETREVPGAEPPMHVHSREDELICVLHGEVTFYRDGELLEATPGTWLYLPRGSEHTFSVASEEAQLLFLLSPAGLESFLQDLDGPGAPAPEVCRVERLVTTAARYGVSITGPAVWARSA